MNSMIYIFSFLIVFSFRRFIMSFVFGFAGYMISMLITFIVILFKRLFVVVFKRGSRV